MQSNNKSWEVCQLIIIGYEHIALPDKLSAEDRSFFHSIHNFTKQDIDTIKGASLICKIPLYACQRSSILPLSANQCFQYYAQIYLFQ